MAALALRGLRKQYANGVTAVADVSLDVADGEFVVLVGPSGCGKSTTLRMVAGLEDISAGQVLIGGRDVTHAPPAERGVAMVFQSYALYPHMSVEQNMGFALTIAGTPAAQVRAKVAQAAEVLQLGSLLGRKPRELSGGQRQRVAIGRAIVRQPGVFLFDEPLSNLDAALRTQMRAELARLHAQLGVTIVYVTHDQVEAMTLGGRIAVFNQGHIEQVGPPMALYQRPANRFVAGFLGAPQMNLLPARREPGLLGADRVAVGQAGALDLGSSSASLRAGQQVASVGVRPEHLQLLPADAASGLEAQVVLVEPLGDVTLVHCRLPGVVDAVVVKLHAGSAAVWVAAVDTAADTAADKVPQATNKPPQTQALPTRHSRCRLWAAAPHLMLFDAQGQVLG